MALGLGEILRQRRVVRDGLCWSIIDRIAPHPSFFGMEQVGHYLGIVHIRRSGYRRVNELGATVDTNMALHAEFLRKPPKDLNLDLQSRRVTVAGKPLRRCEADFLPCLLGQGELFQGSLSSSRQLLRL